MGRLIVVSGKDAAAIHKEIAKKISSDNVLKEQIAAIQDEFSREQTRRDAEYAQKQPPQREVK